jgi:TonB family protein
MFDRLIASKRRAVDRRAVPSGTVSVLVHAGVCAAAVLATLRPHPVAGVDGPPILISWPQPSEDRSNARNGFDPVPGPVAPPIDVPPQAPAVDEPPVLLAGPPLGYPDVLRRAGTTGTVMAQLVIDTLGRAEPGSLVLQSSHPGFEAAARAYVVSALFRPGRTHGRAVRVLVRLPISFTLRPPR